jgi:hypothetical protein
MNEYQNINMFVENGGRHTNQNINMFVENGGRPHDHRMDRVVTVDGNNVQIIRYLTDYECCYESSICATAPLSDAALNGGIVDALAACTFNNPCALATDVNGNVVVAAQATSDYFNEVQDGLAEHGCFELVVVSPDGEPPRTITDVDGHRVWLRGENTHRLDQGGRVVSITGIREEYGWVCWSEAYTVPEVAGPPRISIDRQGNIWCANFFGLQYITNTGLGAGNSFEWNADFFWQPYSMSLSALASWSQQMVLTVLLVGQLLIETELEWALPEELWFCILSMIPGSELGAPRVPATKAAWWDMFDSEILADGGQLGVVPITVDQTILSCNKILSCYPSDRDEVTDDDGWPASDTSRMVQAARDIEDGRTKLQARWKMPSSALGNTRSAPRSGKNRGRKAGWTHRSVQARQEQHEREHGHGGGGNRDGGGATTVRVSGNRKEKE